MTIYELRLVRQDGGPDEVRRYADKRSALDVYQLFFSACSEERYRSVTLAGYDSRTKKGTLLYQTTFVEKGSDGHLIRKDWRNWKTGRPTVYEFHDFDGNGSISGTITETAADHAIMEGDGMQLRIDDDTAFMFR